MGNSITSCCSQRRLKESSANNSGHPSTSEGNSDCLFAKEIVERAKGRDDVWEYFDVVVERLTSQGVITFHDKDEIDKCSDRREKFETLLQRVEGSTNENGVVILARLLHYSMEQEYDNIKKRNYLLQAEFDGRKASTSEASDETNERTNEDSKIREDKAVQERCNLEESVSIDLDAGDMKEMRNYFHLCYLVMIVGNDAAKKILSKYWNYAAFSDWRKNNLQEVIETYGVTKYKFAKFPSIEPYQIKTLRKVQSLDELDLTLVVRLIFIHRDMHHIHKHEKCDVRELVSFRNQLAHNNHLRIAETDYEQKLHAIEHILKALEVQSEVIQRGKTVFKPALFKNFIESMEKYKSLCNPSKRNVERLVESTVYRALACENEQSEVDAITSTTDLVKLAVEKRRPLEYDLSDDGQNGLSTSSQAGWRLADNSGLRQRDEEDGEEEEENYSDQDLFSLYDDDAMVSTETQTEFVNDTLQHDTEDDSVSCHAGTFTSRPTSGRSRVQTPSSLRRSIKKSRLSKAKPRATSSKRKVEPSSNVGRRQRPSTSYPTGRPLYEVIDVKRGDNGDNAWYVVTRYDAGPGHRANRSDMVDRLTQLATGDRTATRPRKLAKGSMVEATASPPPSEKLLTKLAKEIRLPWDIPAHLRERLDI